MSGPIQLDNLNLILIGWRGVNWIQHGLGSCVQGNGDMVLIFSEAVGIRDYNEVELLGIRRA